MYVFHDYRDNDVSIYECDGEAVSSSYGNCTVTIKKKIYDQVENWGQGVTIPVTTADLVGSKEELITRIFSLRS